MEKVITKIRGKVCIKDTIKKYHLERTMCEFSISVKMEAHNDMISKTLFPIRKALAGNKDVERGRIIWFDESVREIGKRDIGIIFWYPYNLKNVPDDLVFDPGRYAITVKTIDNKE